VNGNPTRLALTASTNPIIQRVVRGLTEKFGEIVDWKSTPGVYVGLGKHLAQKNPPPVLARSDEGCG
jgi:hypothetical protein